MSSMMPMAGKEAMKKIRRRLSGMTLTELLCVIAIIAILASLYLGAILRAFRHVVKFLKGMSG
jgi:prepilin-type N-terminal cleavage/methylation domain-containing protein